jgi:hypothetical protein
MAIRRRRLLRRDSGVFILPRFAGAEGGGALATLCIAVREIDWQVIESSSYSLRSIHSSLIPFSQSVISSLKKLRGRSAGRRHCLVSAPRRRAFPLVGVRGAGAPNGARSPTGAPPRHLRQRTNATAQLQPALPGTRRHQVLPASGLSIQSSELPRSTGHSAGRAYPPKPPGSGLRSRPREPHSLRFRDRLEKRPHTSEPLLRNGSRDACQCKSDGGHVRFSTQGSHKKNSCSPYATGKWHHTNAMIGP